MSLRSGLSSLYHEHRQAMRDAKQRQLANKERNERRQEAASAQVGPANAWLCFPRSCGMRILAAGMDAGDAAGLPGVCQGSMSCCRQTQSAACPAVQASTYAQDLLLSEQLQDRSRAAHQKLSQTLYLWLQAAYQLQTPSSVAHWF